MQSSVLSIAPLLVSAVLANHQVLNTYMNISSCLSQPSFYSCENTTSIADTCCSPTPGGLVLQTQFWSTWTGLEHEGQLLPKASWTIHGLWPDNCDGSFNSYCDLSRQYDPTPDAGIAPYTGHGVDTFIRDFGRLDLLDFMEKYWINQGLPNKNFWAHEFSKHATCTSTFDTKCYGPGYKQHQEVIDFFDAVIRAYRMYPTFDILAAAGIVPSNTTAYSLARIESALQSQTGALPHIGCVKGTILSEVWYYNHVWATEQFGTYKHIDTTFASNCNASAPIWYYERTPHSEHEVRN
ncbi:unnamed protein product [Mycena citricolor]|uniref:ribonuclease T2 n=1 Tax=Mycena citricolor TaxID=2018698 RepID=A0AAD2GXR9_9AGAR|nr:unnamed protein product [Mycena citricolor]